MCCGGAHPLTPFVGLLHCISFELKSLVLHVLHQLENIITYYYIYYGTSLFYHPDMNGNFQLIYIFLGFAYYKVSLGLGHSKAFGRCACAAHEHFSGRYSFEAVTAMIAALRP